MRLQPPAYNRLLISLALGLVLLQGYGSASAVDSCEARTINYITDTLPQQCLPTSWSNSAAEAIASNSGPIVIVDVPPAETKDNEAAATDEDDNQELATSSFMSFEEWKELQLKKAEQDAGDPKARNKEDGSAAHEGDGHRDGGGEPNIDFETLSEKVSEIAASGTKSSGETTGHKTHQQQQKQQTHQQQHRQRDGREEAVLYEGGDPAAHYGLSKDAGKTCKERFSYASFDAGATILKTGPRVKNAKAILIENKDSYMLLECSQKSKFVIIELSDDILVDTVVIANFEFFSSMIRHFRVSVSDRYPVKLEKWKVVGTFEARNQRDIQAFLVENPQIWAKYIRIEFLTHYGTEFYCPISLVRVHGTRMMDSWKEVDGGRDDDEEATDLPLALPEAAEPIEEPSSQEPSLVENTTDIPPVVTEMGLSNWRPIFNEIPAMETCEIPTATATSSLSDDSGYSDADSEAEYRSQNQPAHGADEDRGHFATQQSEPKSSSADHPFTQTHAQLGNISLSDPAAPAYHGRILPPPPASYEAASGGANPSAFQSSSPGTDSSRSTPHRPTTSVAKPSSASVKQPMHKPSSTVPLSSRNRTGTNTGGAPAASPTVQESFFKTVAKRLQLLESNTSLSMQYIEDQSRFLQEALTKMERKQISRVDTFLDSLNRTVFTELRSVRAQYDQIWQSTVIALESHRDQSQREIVALSDRLSVLAEEVVFQKRMAILQSVLLLACLVLIIFSRAFGGAASAVALPAGQASSSRWSLALPSSPPPRDYGSRSPSPSPSPSAALPPQPGHADRAGHARYRYAEKTLPLTPTSDYDVGGRNSTPIIHVVDETGEETGYFDDTASFSSPQRLGSESSDAVYSSSDHHVLVDDDDIVISTDGALEDAHSSLDEAEDYLRDHDDDDDISIGDPAEPTGEESGPPLTRTALSQFGDSRKPLPALPESP